MEMHRMTCCLALLACSALAQAGATFEFSPQGEVAAARQVRATFSEAAIRYGDPRAGAVRHRLRRGRQRTLGR